MEGAPFFEGDEFYMPLRFAAKTLRLALCRGRQCHHALGGEDVGMGR